MKISDFNRKELELLKEVYDKISITKKKQETYGSSIGFYLGIWSLRDKGLVMENGIDEKRQKIWILTEKGKEIIKHIIKVDEILGEEHD